MIQCLSVEGFLRPEGGVEARRPYAESLGEVGDRRGLVSLFPEKARCLGQCRVAIERARPAPAQGGRIGFGSWNQFLHRSLYNALTASRQPPTYISNERYRNR